MFITFSRKIKQHHANPANMCSTLPTLHVPTPFILLNASLAVWAISNVMLLLVLLQQLVVNGAELLILFASHAIVADDDAIRANWSQTRGAEKGLPSAAGAVDLRAVWCGTVLEFLRMSANVEIERSSKNGVEIHG